MSKKKKVIVLSCMIALLVTTAVLNFVLSSSALPDGSNVTPTANYFTEVKATRNTSRNMQLSQIDEIISASEDGSAEKTEALAMKLKITGIMEQENLLETLIKAKGFEEVAVTIGMTSDNVSIIVKDADFNQDDAVLIYSLCADEVNATPDNVYIQAIS
ncbi:MAG: SpoIIIAH-like family protein [Clostridiales bacterium]|nr:SpoIIIAH-like family protein [Clostridiales bacterium]